MQVQRKPKKQVIQVAGNPDFENIGKCPAATALVVVAPIPRRNDEITNPKTGRLDWGWFPETNVKTRIFPAGPIRLRYGEHIGPQRGFGLAHIWQARNFQASEVSTPMFDLPAIADFLMEILQSGSQIFYEYGNGKAGDKTTIFKGRNGIVILEERMDSRGNPFYSIVTAFPGKKAYGTLVGVM